MSAKDYLLNPTDRIYNSYLYKVLAGDRTNFRPADRAKMSTIGSFSLMMEYDIRDGAIPFLSTKPTPTKGLFAELVGFMRGEENVRFYLDRGCNFWTTNWFDHYRKNVSSLKRLEKETPEWNAALKEYTARVKTDDAFAQKHGSLGRVYGVQWRRWQHAGKQIDQLGNVIEKIGSSPFSRYHLITAWNPGELKNMALAPCHMTFQFYPRTDRHTGEDMIDISMIQRSCDSLLGVPANQTFYPMLLNYVANRVGRKPGRFTHILQDAHIYVGAGERADWYEQNLNWLCDEVQKARNNPGELLDLRDEILKAVPDEPAGSEGGDHIPFVLTLLARSSKPDIDPRITVDASKSIDEIDVGDFSLTGYPRRPFKDIGDLVLTDRRGKEIKPRMAA